ncbi:FKBP-type peptidyl-prolyl cis-trans isomerase [Actinoplanes subtropicus]|uniref:FKBP-type peptidyl-prolyl cis-trans isomerase n=1 Tax=Actinoplanes subtropicus TaxID=543632 RepID=UPI0005516FAE|nr:FKBP-type peptidyl-prolyl cis-trans isomerase [Actinoplanes subtropicus]
MSTQNAPGDIARRRGQALGGAIAGVAVVVILAIVFITVKPDKSDKSAAAFAPASAAPSAAAPSEAAPSEAAPSEAAPSESAPAPVSVKTPAALAKEPKVTAGGKTALAKLVVTPLVQGTGPKVQKGQSLTANYKVVSYATGQVIDSSWGKTPFVTPIGVGKVIPGFDQAIPGQRVGSRLQIDVPAALAYGEQQGDLRFVVDILGAS